MHKCVGSLFIYFYISYVECILVPINTKCVNEFDISNHHYRGQIFIFKNVLLNYIIAYIFNYDTMPNLYSIYHAFRP